MDGVGTPIIGRPRPLPGHDTPNPAYHPHTLNYEEPLKLYWDIEDSQKEQISCIYCLADILRDYGVPKKAKVFYDLAKSLEDFGPDHIKTLKARNEFAYFYLVQQPCNCLHIF